MRTALSIAGSDSCGGAGIQADIKTMLANGVYAMSAITALTAQTTTGVRAVQEAEPDFLAAQIDAVFEDIRPDAVKIGMVSSAALVRVIADRLRHHGARNVVVDPVMVATSGSSLMRTDAVQALVDELLPLADLATPNIPEAEVLSGIAIANREDMEEAAARIAGAHGCAVLLKGGHGTADASDLLVSGGETRWFETTGTPSIEIMEHAARALADAVREMVTRIVKSDTGGRARLREMWKEDREKLQDLNDFVEETAALLDESQDLNFKRWPILGTLVHQNIRATGSYNAEVEAVKTYITARLKRMDELIGE